MKKHNKFEKNFKKKNFNNDKEKATNSEILEKPENSEDYEEAPHFDIKLFMIVKFF